MPTQNNNPWAKGGEHYVDWSSKNNPALESPYANNGKEYSGEFENAGKEYENEFAPAGNEYQNLGSEYGAIANEVLNEFAPADANVLDSSALFENDREVLGLGNKLNINKTAKDCVTPIGFTNLNQVKSKEIENLRSNLNLSLWEFTKRKYFYREREFEDLFKNNIVKQTEPEYNVLISLQKETWKTTRVLIINPSANFIPINYFQNASGNYNINGFEQEVKRDESFRNSLTKPKFKNLLKTCEDFIAALSTFTVALRKLIEEYTEFKRFDTYYASSEAIKLLSGFEKVTLYSSEVKALNAQESGDFTNIGINGLEGKTKGIVNPIGYPSGTIIGICQLPPDAMNEAIRIAISKGVLISTQTDPRKQPITAILLTIAYLIRVEELLLKTIKKDYKTSCLDFKKCILLGYNAGYSLVSSTINEYCNSKQTTYTFENIVSLVTDKAEKRWPRQGKKEEVSNYVNNIKLRLN